MVFSLGPFITCFITIAFLTLYLYIILYRFNNVLIDNTMKIVFIGIAVIFIRMLIPINFPFTYTIYSTKILPTLGKIIYKDIGIGNLMIINILFIIWIVVSLILLLIFGVRCIHMNKYLNIFVIENCPKYAYIFELFSQYNVENLKMAILPGHVSPAITGIFQPILILPDISKLSAEEIRYICIHEIEHYKNHDLWLKLLLEVVSCLHWWNPFVYLMKKQFTLAMEVSNDKYVAKACPHFNNTIYAECIVKIARSLQKSGKNGLKIDLSFVGKSKSNLQTRVQYILQDSKNPRQTPANFIHLTLIAIVALISFTIVSDATSPMPEEMSDGSVRITKDNCYILETEMGFEVYVDEQYFCTISEIPESFKDYHIYQKGEFHNEN